ncbi:MAG: hypothetical protein GY803_01485 [Chloroflexi bacterium]|nr:hypothetical protein [Chloroflexota bacterium]
MTELIGIIAFIIASFITLTAVFVTLAYLIPNRFTTVNPRASFLTRLGKCGIVPVR